MTPDKSNSSKIVAGKLPSTKKTTKKSVKRIRRDWKFHSRHIINVISFEKILKKMIKGK